TSAHRGSVNSAGETRTVLFTPCEYHMIAPSQLSARCRYTTAPASSNCSLGAADAEADSSILAPAKVPHNCTWPLLIREATVATISSSLVAKALTVRTRSRRV